MGALGRNIPCHVLTLGLLTRGCLPALCWALLGTHNASSLMVGETTGSGGLSPQHGEENNANVPESQGSQESQGHTPSRGCTNPGLSDSGFQAGYISWVPHSLMRTWTHVPQPLWASMPPPRTWGEPCLPEHNKELQNQTVGCMAGLH